ncbi:MAG: type II secretion system F family protein [Bacillota bacterium]
MAETLRRLRDAAGWSARNGPDEDDLEEGLYALASALEAGSGIIQALGLAAEQSPPRLAHEFLRITDEFAAGVPLPECLSHARDRVPQSSFASLCDTIDIQRLSGGDLRAGLASLTDIIRERRELRQELKVKTTEARQSAIVLALIPPIIGAAAWLMNPELMAPLWVYPAGRLGLAAGVGLWLLGGWTAARLTRVRALEE